MGFKSVFSVLLCLIAAAHAGQLTLQSPRLTVLGPDGSQLRSESYVTQLHFLRSDQKII